ncbi:MAG: hypothetical protein NZ533_05365 [Casimicrobiaceae bacterium]|nr:hypothetical protein [Casimicrobiaceae bacterium]MDW8311507.1 hypothetical protein [Burkholderiales bacterium]
MFVERLACTRRATRPLLCLPLVLSGCGTVPPPRVDYPAPVASSAAAAQPTAAPAPAAPVAPAPTPQPPPASAETPRPVEAELRFERSELLAETLYRNPEALLRQIAPSGAMGVNRGQEGGATRGTWFIDEQRFAATLVGAGINRNRRDLIEAGLRALEWGFQQQGTNGGFATPEPVISSAYFVAAAAYSLWLVEAAGASETLAARWSALRPRLARAASWLERAAEDDAMASEFELFTSRRIVVGYALAMSGRVLETAQLVRSGERHLREALRRQHEAGYFLERGGFDVGFQAEALVYLLRFYDQVASAEARRQFERPIVRALAWLESRVDARGVVLVAGSTRSAGNLERDRTGQPRRVSPAALIRAFGLARYVLGEPRYEALARAIANARQPA